jgi:Spy/CpxP family protein refolding chaperone
MKLWGVINLSLAAVLAAGISAAAQESGSGPGRGPGMAGPGFGMHRPPMERMLGLNGGRWWNSQAMIDRLKLTDDQRKAMDQILLDHRKELIDKRADVEKAEVDMEPLMQDDQPNESRVLAQIDKVAQTRAELEKANARFLLAIRAKLTPDQWKELKAARTERIEHRQWRKDGHGNMPQGGPQPGEPGPGPQGLLNELSAPDMPEPDPDTGTR